MGNWFPEGVSIKAISVLVASATLALTGCASISHEKQGPKEAPVVVGPPVRDNFTPLRNAYACYKEQIASIKPIGIGVGDVKDYTGKYSDSEGNAITQGGALMVMSALGKLAPAIRQHERFDTRIAELELVYMDRKQLGGGKYVVDGKEVPWEPYYGGSIHGSDYFIVGGITELNYNIQSGGAEFQVNQVGPKGRTYVINVAADLRIVDTRSLIVQHTVSLQKQIVGYEVGFGIFRFFGTNLFDLNTGAKNQEPLQLGVRTVLELGVLELVSAVTKVPYQNCMSAGGVPPEIYTPKDAPWSRAAAVANARPAPKTAMAAPAAVPAAAPAPAVAAVPEPDASDLQQRLAALKSAPVPTPRREPTRNSAEAAPAQAPAQIVPATKATLPTVSLSDILTGGELRLEDPPAATEEEEDQPTADGPAVTGGAQLAQRAARITLE